MQPKSWIMKTQCGLLRVQAKIELKWWARFCLSVGVLYCVLTHKQVDHDSFAGILRKGVIVKFEYTPVTEGEAHE